MAFHARCCTHTQAHSEPGKEKSVSADFQSLKIRPGTSLLVVIDRNKVQKLRKSLIDQQLLKKKKKIEHYYGNSPFTESSRILARPVSLSLNNRQPTGSG